MHASQLAQMAAIVARHGPLIVESSEAIPLEVIQRYWTASKCRLDRWARALQVARASTKSASLPTQASLPRRREKNITPILEEILLSEPLTRVWRIIAQAYDLQRNQNEVQPIAQSIFIGQMEARNRLLRLLVDGNALSAEHSIALNRLRRRIERWTDLLVGYLGKLDASYEMAFDRIRASDFSADLCCPPIQQQAAWSLAIASLQSTLVGQFRSTSPNHDLNEQIASSLLAIFGSSLFDSIGLPASLWQIRLASAATDSQGYIEDLLEMDEESTPYKSKWNDLGARF